MSVHLSHSQQFCSKLQIIAIICLFLSLPLRLIRSMLSPEYCNRKVIIFTSIDVFNHCKCSMRAKVLVLHIWRCSFRCGTSGAAIMSLNANREFSLWNKRDSRRERESEKKESPKCEWTTNSSAKKKPRMERELSPLFCSWSPAKWGELVCSSNSLNSFENVLCLLLLSCVTDSLAEHCIFSTLFLTHCRFKISAFFSPKPACHKWNGSSSSSRAAERGKDGV